MTPHDVQRLAEACAKQLPSPGGSFEQDAPRFASSLHALVDAVQQLDARLVFDRAGRPGAIAAIRTALPEVERELLCAVVEDHACEMAATREALYQLVLAVRRRPDHSG